jgi:hypothetical protein
METPENAFVYEKSFLEDLEVKYPLKMPFIYMFIGAMFMSLNAYCAKMLTGVETFEILLFRSLIMIVMLGIYFSK